MHANRDADLERAVTSPTMSISQLRMAESRKASTTSQMESMSRLSLSARLEANSLSPLCLACSIHQLFHILMPD